jgi:hypothetical protein
MSFFNKNSNQEVKIMHISKKILIMGIICVTVLAATIGGFAIASAADNGVTGTPSTTAATQLLDKVAQIYQQNTGIAIDSQELQKAFQQAQTELNSTRLDTMLQKLVTDGKITQEQADQWKTWWNSRPSSITSDEFKTWMESRPDIPGMFGGGTFGKAMPFGRGGCIGSDNGAANSGVGMMRGNRFNTQQR